MKKSTEELYDFENISDRELLEKVPYILETLSYLLSTLPKYNADISNLKNLITSRYSTIMAKQDLHERDHKIKYDKNAYRPLIIFLSILSLLVGPMTALILWIMELVKV